MFSREFPLKEKHLLALAVRDALRYAVMIYLTN
jgi:hypothetical protein